MICRVVRVALLLICSSIISATASTPSQPPRSDHGDAVRSSTAAEEAPLGEGPVQTRAALQIGAQLNPVIDPVSMDSAYLGMNVAVGDGLALVGAPYDDHSGLADAGVVYAYIKRLGTWILIHRIVALDAAAGDHFGSSVAISGSIAVIGAESADISGDSAAGAVYVFHHAGDRWAEDQKLIASDSDHDFYLGCDVDIEGDTLVAGAWGADHGYIANTGAAYVFTLSGGTWTEQQKLVPSDAAYQDQTGESVAISGETVTFSGVRDDYSGLTDTGSAYVFTRSGGTWTEEQKLIPSDAANEDRFGRSIDIDGDTVVVGASSDNHSGLAAPGSAYVFTRSGTSWTQEQKLTASDAASYEHLGFAVALSGDIVMAGNNTTVSGFISAGAVYVFERSGSSWSESQKLENPDPETQEYFGWAIDIGFGTTLIGAERDNNGTGDDAGAAYFHALDSGTWIQEQKVTGADSTYSDRFGKSVSISGDRAVVGAPRDDHSGSTDAGSATVFIRVGGVWSVDAKFLPINPASFQYYGESVAVDGDTAVVGSLESHSGLDLAGAVFVFVRYGGGWVQEQRLTAPTPNAYGRFGSAVALWGSTLAVGAYGNDPTETGAVYIFTNPGSGFVYQDTLVASDATSHDMLGSSVALDGDTLIAGAPGVDYGAFLDPGAAYVFTRSGGVWSGQQKLLNPTPSDISLFGLSVAVDGETAIVGARNDDHSGLNNPGAAHVFHRPSGTWILRQTLQSSTPVDAAWFGSAVAASGDLVLIAAERDDYGAYDLGALYLFQEAGGVLWEHQVVTPADPTAKTFGSSLAYDGISAVVGADLGSTGPLPEGYLSGVVFILDPAAEVDLSIFKDNSEVTVVPGEDLTYTITARNVSGPSSAFGASVTDVFPTELNDCSWTCTASGGGSCLAGGVGDIDELVDLPIGGEVVFTATCTLGLAATGTLSNTASITVPQGMHDPYSGDNSATDIDDIETATADLRALVNFDLPYIVTGSAVQFYAIADNAIMPGSHDVYGVSVSNIFPPELSNCSWTCTPNGGAACTAGPVMGDIIDIIDLPYQGWAYYVITCEVPGPVGTSVVDTMTVTPPAYAFDPDLSNNTATDTSLVVLGVDFGDAPDSYYTLANNDGASHGVLPGHFIGAGVDGDNDGQPTALADGDDTAAMDDEDVLSGTPIVTAGGPTIDLELSAGGSGYLSIWVDLNIDGDWFDAGEKVVDSALLTAGPNTVPVDIPASASPGLTYVRLRFSSIPILQSLNELADGEVEDHRIRIVLPGTLIFADDFESGTTSAWSSY